MSDTEMQEIRITQRAFECLQDYAKTPVNAPTEGFLRVVHVTSKVLKSLWDAAEDDETLSETIIRLYEAKMAHRRDLGLSQKED